jgi:DNA-binding NarL/FixJ family response regulator
VATDWVTESAPQRALHGDIAVAISDEVTLRRIRTALAGTDFDVSVDVADAAELAVTLGDGREFAAVVLGCAAKEQLATLRAVRADLSDTPLVLVAPAGQRHSIRKALEAGADGIVDEALLETALVPTLYAVCAGQVALPREVKAQVEKPALSAREKQVLGMVVMGFTNNEIANRLYLAESTVKSHLSSAFGKLGVRSRSEASALILDPDQALGPGILMISEDAGKRSNGATE